MNTLSNDDLNDDSSLVIRGPFNFCKDTNSAENALTCPEPTLTQQHEQDETDINYIVQRFTQTGLLPEPRVLPTYGDFTSDVSDYQTALNLIIQADEAFSSLPAKARGHFDNSPARFLDFMENNPDPQTLLDLGIADRVSTGRETQPTPTAPPAPDPKAPSE